MRRRLNLRKVRTAPSTASLRRFGFFPLYLRPLRSHALDRLGGRIKRTLNRYFDATFGFFGAVLLVRFVAHSRNLIMADNLRRYGVRDALEIDSDIMRAVLMAALSISRDRCVNAV